MTSSSGSTAGRVEADEAARSDKQQQTTPPPPPPPQARTGGFLGRHRLSAAITRLDQEILSLQVLFLPPLFVRPPLSTNQFLVIPLLSPFSCHDQQVPPLAAFTGIYIDSVKNLAPLLKLYQKAKTDRISLFPCIGTPHAQEIWILWVS